MDFELKSFEDKINDITEQFMSLLDENDSSLNNTDYNTETDVYNPKTNTVRKENLNIDFSKITSDYDKTDIFGANDISTSSFEDELDKRLEDLYQSKNNMNNSLFEEKPVMNFADSTMNTNKFNFGFAPAFSTNDKTNSYSERGGVNMENKGKDQPMAFGGIKNELDINSNVATTNSTSTNVTINPITAAGSTATTTNSTNTTTATTNPTDNLAKPYAFAMPNNVVKPADIEIEENTLFSFATIPQERALTKKRTWKDTLFMDIPWDTKIDIFGAIKSVFNTDIKFTF